MVIRRLHFRQSARWRVNENKAKLVDANQDAATAGTGSIFQLRLGYLPERSRADAGWHRSVPGFLGRHTSVCIQDGAVRVTVCRSSGEGDAIVAGAGGDGVSTAANGDRVHARAADVGVVTRRCGEAVRTIARRDGVVTRTSVDGIDFGAAGCSCCCHPG